jgi:hypothetical protein
MHVLPFTKPFALILVSALGLVTGCGGSGTTSNDKNSTPPSKVDSRAIYAGIDNVDELTVDDRYVYWSLSVDGDDVDDIGGVWRGNKDGSSAAIRLEKARDASMLTLIGEDVFFIDKDGDPGVMRASRSAAGTATNISNSRYATRSISSDGQRLYALTNSEAVLLDKAISAYDPKTGTWSELLKDAGTVDNMAVAGEYVYFTMYGENDGNGSLARVAKAGGSAEVLRVLETKYGDLYSAGTRLLLRSWGPSNTTKVEELDVATGAVKQAIDVAGCEDNDNWRNHAGSFYCFTETGYEKFAETSTADPIPLTAATVWSLAIDDAYVYWAATQSISANELYVTSEYIGRQRL